MFYKTNREDLKVNLPDHLEGTESCFIKSQREVKFEVCEVQLRLEKAPDRTLSGDDEISVRTVIFL